MTGLEVVLYAKALIDTTDAILYECTTNQQSITNEIVEAIQFYYTAKRKAQIEIMKNLLTQRTFTTLLTATTALAQLLETN